MPTDHPPQPVRAYAVLRDGTINLGDIHETRQIAEMEHDACSQPERHEVVEVGITLVAARAAVEKDTADE